MFCQRFYLIVLKKKKAAYRKWFVEVGGVEEEDEHGPHAAIGNPHSTYIDIHHQHRTENFECISPINTH